VTGNWFEIEQMMRSRQHDLLREAASLQRAEAIRAARTAAPGSMGTARAEHGRPVPTTGVTLTARLGGTLVAIGRRLQGVSVSADDAATCDVCGKHFQGSVEFDGSSRLIAEEES
jgi:hypothetical protein